MAITIALSDSACKAVSHHFLFSVFFFFFISHPDFLEKICLLRINKSRIKKTQHSKSSAQGTPLIIECDHSLFIQEEVVSITNV